MHARTDLSSDPRSAAAARRFVLGAVGDWGLSDVDGRLALLVSELVTNAIRHASGSSIGLGVTWDGMLVRVDVHDGATRRPHRRLAEADAIGGRGLVLVESLAHDWGVESTADGKSVWFSLALDGAARRDGTGVG